VKNPGFCFTVSVLDFEPLKFPACSNDKAVKNPKVTANKSHDTQNHKLTSGEK